MGIELDPEEMISAQVVVLPASGKVPDGARPPSVENLSEYLPDIQDVEDLMKFFASKGMEIGPLVGNSFSITGTALGLAKLFETEFLRDPDGSIICRPSEGDSELTLPLEPLPDKVRRLIESVEFTPPPDFGPTFFF